MKKRDRMGEVILEEEEERSFCFYLEKAALDGGKCGMGGTQNGEEQHNTGSTVLARGECPTNGQRVNQKGNNE